MKNFINIRDISKKDLKKIIFDSKIRKKKRSKLNNLDTDKDIPLKGKFLIIPKLIFNTAQVAMASAMKDKGMKGATYELTVAISIIMTKICDGEFDALVEDDLAQALLPENFKV